MPCPDLGGGNETALQSKAANQLKRDVVRR
jgi:hypothetical protein